MTYKYLKNIYISFNFIYFQVLILMSHLTVMTTISTVPRSHIISHLEFWSFNGFCFHLLVVVEWCLVCFQCASKHHNQLMWKQLKKIHFLYIFSVKLKFFSWNYFFTKKKFKMLFYIYFLLLKKQRNFMNSISRGKKIPLPLCMIF